MNPTNIQEYISTKVIEYLKERDETLKECDKKLATNWITVELFAVLNKKNLTISQSPISAKNLSSLIKMITSGKISGKIAKDVLSGSINFQSNQIGVLSVGFIASFIAGLFACKWMLAIVKKSKLSYFALYCFIVGIIAISITLLNN